MPPDATFEIKIPQFEGPFDLLLFFIERDELDIQTISISSITDEFLIYIHHFNTLNIELASEFIVVAATLMRIKAKTLLPRPAPEGSSEQDPEEDLIRRLIIYKGFKDLAEEFKLLEEQRFQQERRGSIPYDLSLAAQLAEPAEELSGISVYRLMQVYERLLSKSNLESAGVRHTVEQYAYSIEKQKEIISTLLLINQKLDFQQLRQSSDNKIEFIYTFLAVLEMLQQELLSVQIGLGYNNFSVSAKDGAQTHRD